VPVWVSAPTAGYQISTLIFEMLLWKGGLYKYPINNILRTAKFLPTWILSQKIFPEPLADLSAWEGFCTSSPQQGVKNQL
jgi:hypothetical protein